jgi:hypothetical protein
MTFGQRLMATWCHSRTSTIAGSHRPSIASSGVLHYYKIELWHLNPNGIQHFAAFIMLCEGYLGIEPHFDLWQYFFFVGCIRGGNTVGRR